MFLEEDDEPYIEDECEDEDETYVEYPDEECMRCNSLLDSCGYCIDQGCMYSDYLQDEETDEDE